MANILSTGISALNAFQRQLATTGHNIANVNTEGYSRQRVDFNALEAQGGSAGAIGSGVEVSSVRRTYNDYLAGQVRDYQASNEEYSIYYDRASQIDNVIGDEASGIDQIMQEFFASVHDVSTDPTSIPARTVMLNNAQMLTDRFQSLNGWLDNLRSETNRDLGNFVSDVNGIADSIASINQRIQSVSVGNASPPNDLLDQRDQLIDQLSGYVNVNTVTQDDGSMNVFIGNGQALVVGGTASSLSVVDNPAAGEQKELAITQAGGSSVTVTNQITGGKLGGLLRFRSEVLDPAQNSLGLVAIGLAQNFNDQHILGTDLGGNPGAAFFGLASPQVLANSNNTGAAAVTATFSSVSDLTNHDYQLSFDGANWAITDNSTGSTSVLGPPGTYIQDGVQISIGAGGAAGDTYLLRPTRSGAAAIDTLVTDPHKVAAAQTGAVGDNRNALALADLQNKSVLFGNTAGLTDAYGYLVADVGSKTHQAGSNAEVQKQLLGQAESAKSAVSGVNLDEEAADLVRFQQAYAAAAQVIATANTLFDTLLGAVRG